MEISLRIIKRKKRGRKNTDDFREPREVPYNTFLRLHDILVYMCYSCSLTQTGEDVYLDSFQCKLLYN